MTPSPAWARALRALTLLAIDPEGLRGLTLSFGTVYDGADRVREQ